MNTERIKEVKEQMGELEVMRARSQAMGSLKSADEWTRQLQNLATELIQLEGQMWD